ncbi:MDR family MFS transporter [Dellaglioa algida]|uniref:MDR family MFS transporter n=1 Tax=Dellaglioa algida TaxID=105612 RepID=UPI0024C4E147|nr:MDR family MFS transporter [Dellaglioa algida]MDK1726837.1 DHA2 family efflux MFS transporter permease subunit [Dellaglioa algida]
MIKNKKILLGLIALSLIMFMVTLDTTITNIALPDITNSFNSNLTDTNWISTIYVLIMSITIIPASKFGDQFGRKKIMCIGLIIFGIGSALCGLSNTLPTLIFTRFIQGIGGAIVTPIMIPLSVNLFGRKDANQAVGIIGAVTAVAAAAGPSIGGIILKFLNWKWIFFVNVPIVIITFILILFCFEESFDPTISKKIDLGGLIFLTLCLSQLTFLLVKGYDIGWNSITSFSLILGTLITFLIFLWIELKVRHPLVELNLFKEMTFSASTIIYFMCGFAIVCSSLIFNFFLENVRGYSALSASYIIMFMSITVMISMPLGSKLSTYIGYRSVITTGMVLMAGSLFLLSNLKPRATNQLMIFFMIILGFGFGFACLSIVSAVQFIPENKAGIASGIVNAARQLGTCLGIALLVGTMTHNVDTAKNTIERRSIDQITSKKLPNNIDNLIKTRVITILNSNKVSPNFQYALKKSISEELKSDNTNYQIKNKELSKMHTGLGNLKKQFNGNPNTVSSLTNKISIGQNEITAQYNALLYELVKDNPNAITILNTYEKKLIFLQSQPKSIQNSKSITQLSSLISIYKIGTNPNITTGKAFTKALSSRSADNNITQAQDILSKTLSKDGKINKGLTTLDGGVSKIDVNEQITKLLSQIKNLKNKQLTQAFTKTFMLAAWIIASFSLVGLFTERKHK